VTRMWLCTIRSLRRFARPSLTARLARGSPSASEGHRRGSRCQQEHGAQSPAHPLRDVGLLEFRRGRGVTVVGAPERGLLVSRARQFIAFARRYGYRRADVLKLIEELP